MNAALTAAEAIKGSKDAFISLIRANEQTMYRTARSMLKSDSDTADAIQETILKAYKGIRELREPAFFRTWLVRILINECRQLIRKNSKLVPLTGAIEQTQATSGGLDAKMDMELLLNRLDLEQKEVVVLYYMEDMSVKEIARMLEISEGTVKSRLYRARMKLAVMLDIIDSKEETQ